MLGVQAGISTVLADEVELWPNDLLGASRMNLPSPLVGPPRRVFISHAASDKPLAEAIREVVREYLPDSRVFVASRPGHITTGEEWWGRITSELRSADAFIVLLTADSVGRPWINFETGAAWFSGRTLLTLTHGIPKRDVPMPIQALQLSSVEDPQELAAALSEIGIQLPDPSETAAALAAVNPVAGTFGWVGVTLDGRYFAWEGPGLHALQDRQAEPAPKTLLDALPALGWRASFALPRNLDRTLGSGAALVYETDRRTWRRRLWGVGGEQVLVVRPAGSK